MSINLNNQDSIISTNNNNVINVCFKNNDYIYPKKMTLYDKLLIKKKEEESKKKEEESKIEQRKIDNRMKFKNLIIKLSNEIENIKENDYQLDKYLKKKIMNRNLDVQKIKQNKNNLEKIKNLVNRKK